MRWTWVMIAAAGLAQPPWGAALAQSTAELTQFEKALEARDREASARQFDALAAARRPADGRLRPDPLLNGLYGRLLMEMAQYPVARAFLEHADDPGAPEPQRTKALLALAELQLSRSDRAAAAVTLAKLPQLPADKADAKKLILLRASERMLDSAAETIAVLQPLAGDWKADWLRAQAHQLAGNKAEARAAADRAWIEAASAPADERAPARVALLRAGLAASAGDRDAVKAMLTVAGAWAFALPDDLAGALPSCGADGLKPDDWVTFAVVVNGPAGKQLFPTGASRPTAVAPFERALSFTIQAGADQVGNGAVGTIFTVRCRVAPGTDFQPARQTEEWAEFMAQRGLFPTLRADDEAIRDLAQELEDLTERYGENNPIVIPQVVGLGGRLAARAGVDSGVEPARVFELQTQLHRLMRSAGASASMLPSDEELKIMTAVAANGPPRENAIGILRTTTRSMVARLPFDFAAGIAIAWLKSDTGLPLAERRATIERLLARPDAPPAGDRRRRTLLMTLAGIEKQAGNVAAARRLYRSAGLAPDLCLVQDEAPNLIAHEIDTEDYPTDVIPFAFEGRTLFELDVDATGKMAAPRIVLATPSEMFEATAVRELATVRLTAAVSDGVATPCRGYAQSIVWRLPDETDEPFIGPVQPTPMSTF